MEKKKLYILHGWSYDTKKWQPLLNSLSKYYDPVLLKIPGLTKKIIKPWTIKDYTNWLEKELAEEKNIYLLGHSNGGRLALSYILKHKKRVAKLILIDSAGIHHKDIKKVVKRVLFKSLAKMGKKVTKSEKLKNLLYKFARESDYNQAPEVMKRTMENLINVDLTNDLDKIDTKTLIIWGEEDKTTPIKDAYLFNEKLKNSKLKIIKNAKHSPQFTKVDIVSKLITDFIKS
jgi:abhydrolase domain-containing protein 6